MNCSYSVHAIQLPSYKLHLTVPGCCAAERYGPLRSVWIARKPPGFAFIEYEDTRDAEDAVRKMDGGAQLDDLHELRTTSIHTV